MGFRGGRISRRFPIGWCEGTSPDFGANIGGVCGKHEAGACALHLAHSQTQADRNAGLRVSVPAVDDPGLDCVVSFASSD